MEKMKKRDSTERDREREQNEQKREENDNSIMAVLIDEEN